MARKYWAPERLEEIVRIESKNGVAMPAGEFSKKHGGAHKTIRYDQIEGTATYNEFALSLGLKLVNTLRKDLFKQVKEDIKVNGPSSYNEISERMGICLVNIRSSIIRHRREGDEINTFKYQGKSSGSVIRSYKLLGNLIHNPVVVWLPGQEELLGRHLADYVCEIVDDTLQRVLIYQFQHLPDKSLSVLLLHTSNNSKKAKVLFENIDDINKIQARVLRKKMGVYHPYLKRLIKRIETAEYVKQKNPHKMKKIYKLTKSGCDYANREFGLEF